MESEQVTGKILADARTEAEKIKAQADKKQAAEQAKLNNEIKEYTSQTEVLAKKAAEDKKARMLSAARMDIAKQYLGEKGKLLDEVFDKARGQFFELSDGEYKALIKKLMLAAVETGDEEVIVDKNEEKIDFEFVKQINRDLGPGFHGNLRLSEQKQDIGGGFILRRGRIQNNVSIDVLLDKAREALEIEIGQELFADK